MRRRRFLSLAAIGTPCLITCAKLPHTQAPSRVADRVTLKTELANRYVRSNKTSEMLARIRIATKAGAELERPGANVALVMDASASMRGDAIEQAKTAALALLDSLRDDDVLSVVAFGSRPEVIVSSTVLDPVARPAVREKLQAIDARGTTDLAGGMQSGLAELSRRLDPGVPRLHRVVLLSDGVPNDASPIPGLAASAKSYGAPITALGVGIEFHETLLAQMAQISGGRFQFVEDASRIAALFEEEVLDLEHTLARGLALRLQPGPGIGVLEIVGHAPGWSGQAAVLSLGDLSDGQSHELLVRMSVGEHVEGATVELLDVELTFVDALDPTGKTGEHRDFLELEVTDDEARIAAARNDTLERDALRLRTAAVTLEAMRLARDGALQQAHTELDRLEAPDLKKAAKDDDQLGALLDDAAKLRKTLPELAPAPSPTVGHAAAPRMPSPADGAGGEMPSPKTKLENRSIHARAYEALH